MKQFLGMLAIISIVLFTVGCPNDVPTPTSTPTPTPTYTVTFNTNGGSSSLNATVAHGSKLTPPTAPTKQRYILLGWYKDSAYKTAWDFATDTVSANITLYAKWVKEITMISVPGGTFTMGSTDGDDDEKPAHSVTVSDFSLGETEVTQGQWEAVMGTWPGASENESPATSSTNFGVGDNYPAYYISWYDAVEFCNALSVKESLEKVYTIDKDTEDINNTSDNDDIKWTVTADFTKNGYRLPTESEWEYAAGGGKDTKTRFAGTNNKDDLVKYAWYKDNNISSGTKEVGTRKSNSLDLYDMSGNVWEWCWDLYAEYDTPTTDSELEYVFRGGGSSDDANKCRVTSRGSDTPDSRYDALGFRVARSL